MNVEELRRLIEAQGYEVKSIRVFKNSFHVTYWGKRFKITRIYRVSLSSVEWSDVKRGFPKEGGL